MKYKTISLTFAVFAIMATSNTVYASDTMNGAQLDALITGNTLYVDIPKGAPGAPEGGIAPIYYATDGTVKALLPAGPMLDGKMVN